MIQENNLDKRKPVTNLQRTVFGFALGIIIMFVATRIFQTNSYDFENISRGIKLLLSGINPWAEQTRIYNFYNPPHSVLFLWPMLFASPKACLIVGAAFLFAFVFYHKSWVALAWFATNTALWLVAAGGIDMYIVGLGLILLLIGDNNFPTKRGLAFRIAAYGLLMIKPQCGIFIVFLYVLTRHDWKGVLLSCFIYGVLFLPLYPSWINVIINDPPLAQTEATHTFFARFGPIVASLVALGVLVSRKWQYWQLGGALASLLTPYGMPGIPSFLILTAVKSYQAIPIFIIWSAALASLTWIDPPSGVDFYDYLAPFMAIFHLSINGLALTLACLSPDAQGPNLINVIGWIRQKISNGFRIQLDGR